VDGGALGTDLWIRRSSRFVARKRGTIDWCGDFSFSVTASGELCELKELLSESTRVLIEFLADF
jgi:hypothetical protein